LNALPGTIILKHPLLILSTALSDRVLGEALPIFGFLPGFSSLR
jgi:hypothetical protein